MTPQQLFADGSVTSRNALPRPAVRADRAPTSVIQVVSLCDGTPACLVDPAQDVPRWVEDLPVPISSSGERRIHDYCRRGLADGRVAAALRAVAESVRLCVDDVHRRPDDDHPVRGLVKPLTSAMLSVLLGVPAEDCSQFIRWMTALTPGVALSDRDATSALPYGYVCELVEWRTTQPGDDLLSALCEQAGDTQDGERLGELDVLRSVQRIVDRIHGSTARQLDQALQARLARVGLCPAPHSSAEVAAAAVAEISGSADLCADTPQRHARTELPLGPFRIPAGTRILLSTDAESRECAWLAVERELVRAVLCAVDARRARATIALPAPRPAPGLPTPHPIAAGARTSE